jgi:hypothetical protein
MAVLSDRHRRDRQDALPPDVAGGKVIASPGIMMKFSERARSTPRNGASVKITDGFVPGRAAGPGHRSRVQSATTEGARVV